ncbi:MAG: hypothetical protein WCO53_15245, partial [Deltaproteobacteria bacterium]
GILIVDRKGDARFDGGGNKRCTLGTDAKVQIGLDRQEDVDGEGVFKFLGQLYSLGIAVVSVSLSLRFN